MVRLQNSARVSSICSEITQQETECARKNYEPEEKREGVE